MRARRAAAIGAALLTAASLSACGTPRVAPSSASAPPPPPAMMPMASDFVSAVMRTRGLGSAHVDITGRTSVASGVRDLTGVGSIDVGRGFGNILWTSDKGQTREIVNDVAVFTQSDVPGGLWTRLPDGESTSTTELADALAGLGTLEGLTEAGTEEVGGAPASRYTGQQPADPVSLAALGLSPDEFADLGDAWQGASIDIAAWVDGAGRIVRVDRSFDLVSEGGSDTTVRVSTLLSDFGGNMDVAPPPSASVTSKAASSASATRATQ